MNTDFHRLVFPAFQIRSSANRRLRGLMRILFSGSCRGRRCRPVGSNVLYAMLSACSRKRSELDVCFELPKVRTWTKKDVVLAR
jgi:hypothetical protein